MHLIHLTMNNSLLSLPASCLFHYSGSVFLLHRTLKWSQCIRPTNTSETIRSFGWKESHTENPPSAACPTVRSLSSQDPAHLYRPTALQTILLTHTHILFPQREHPPYTHTNPSKKGPFAPLAFLLLYSLWFSNYRRSASSSSKCSPQPRGAGGCNGMESIV